MINKITCTCLITLFPCCYLDPWDASYFKFFAFYHFFIFVVLYTVFDNVVCFSDNCLWELHYTKILPLKWVLWFLFFYFFGCYVGLNFQLYRIFFFKIFSTSILFTKSHKPLSFLLPLRLRLSCWTRVLQQIYVMVYSSLISSNKEVLHFLTPQIWDFSSFISPKYMRFSSSPVSFHYKSKIFIQFCFLWPQVYSDRKSVV